MTDTQSKSDVDNANAAGQKSDLAADAPDTPAEASKVQSNFRTDLPPDLEKDRDKLAEYFCSKGHTDSSLPSTQKPTHLKKMLGLVKCRVQEQDSWLDNSYLYSTNSETACKNQTAYLLDEVLNFQGDEGTGEKWLESACKAIADKVFTPQRIKSYEKDGSRKSLASLKSELESLLKSTDPFVFLPGITDTSGDDNQMESSSTDIQRMLAYSLFRLNHNCSTVMDTEKFDNKITKDAGEGSVKAHYIYTRHNAESYNDISENPFSEELTMAWPSIAQHVNVWTWKAVGFTDTKNGRFTGANAITARTAAESKELPTKNKLLANLWKNWYQYDRNFELVSPSIAKITTPRTSTSSDAITPLRVITSSCDASAYYRHKQHVGGDKAKQKAAVKKIGDSYRLFSDYGYGNSFFDHTDFHNTEHNIKVKYVLPHNISKFNKANTSTTDDIEYGKPPEGFRCKLSYRGDRNSGQEVTAVVQCWSEEKDDCQKSSKTHSLQFARDDGDNNPIFNLGPMVEPFTPIAKGKYREIYFRSNSNILNNPGQFLGFGDVKKSYIPDTATWNPDTPPDKCALTLDDDQFIKFFNISLPDQSFQGYDLCGSKKGEGPKKFFTYLKNTQVSVNHDATYFGSSQSFKKKHKNHCQ
ncbi:MAG: hypothetical protein OXC44_02310 [Proteobacteria bacterium]|nr:hypothetical protein [Pseudomonadota bacterium]